MPIYTATTVDSGKPQSSEFTSRGVAGMTQAQLSHVPLYGKAEVPEIAYAGYKANIDMFLLATLEGQRLRVDVEGRGAPMDRDITNNPLAVVNVAFTFVKQPTEEGLEKIRLALESYGFGSVAISKTSSVYVVDNIPVNLVVSKLARLANPTAGTPKGYCTIEAAVASYYLFLGIESFLAVNQYPYARNNATDEDNEENDWGHDIRHVYELGVRKAQEELSEELPKKKKAKKTKKKGPAVEVGSADVDMEDDEVPDEDKHYFSSGMNEVMYAKPSAMINAENNRGPPSLCPKYPGLVFPYFEGIIANDPAFVRSKMLDLFFRFLGIEKEDQSPRPAYKTWRSAIISFTSTASGLIVQHILKGIELALDTQTQLYVLHEGRNYLGFVLCGGMFSVFHQGNWVEPLDRKELQAELSDVLTHDFALELVALELNGMKLAHDNSAPMIEVKDLDTPLKLATKLGLLKWEQDEEGLETEKRVCDAMKRLSFDNVNPWSVDNLDQVIAGLTLLLNNDPLPEDLPITLPLSNFQNCAKRSFLVFSAFGTKGFSFREAGKGDEYAVPRTEEDIAKFMEKEGEGKAAKLRIAGLVLCIKGPHQCMLDWDTFLAKGSMKYNLKERAVASKNKLYTEKGMAKILPVLLAGVTAGAFKGKGKAKATGESAGSALMVFGDGEIDDLF